MVAAAVCPRKHTIRNHREGSWCLEEGMHEWTHTTEHEVHVFAVSQTIRTLRLGIRLLPACRHNVMAHNGELGYRPQHWMLVYSSQRTHEGNSGVLDWYWLSNGHPTVAQQRSR